MVSVRTSGRRRPNNRGDARHMLALFLVGSAALGSVACGAARPIGDAMTLRPAGPASTIGAIGKAGLDRRGIDGVDAADRPESFEAALLARVNADRAAYGLRELAFDPDLQATARARAAAQMPAQALSHAEPAGATSAPYVFQRLLKEAGLRYSVAGENLARPHVPAGADAAQSAAAAQRALMASATHRQNILDPAFDRMAVGVTRG